jgi:hypothetical protein
MHDHDDHTRHIARVVRDLLRAQLFDSIADLKVALKAQLRALNIPYLPAELDQALTLVASNTPLASSPWPRTPPDRLLSEPPVLSREDATQILAKLESRYAVRLRDLSDPRRRDRDPDAG